MSPGGRGLQAALSHLLVDGELRAVWLEHPEEIRRRYALSESEARMLGGIDSARLDLTAHAGERKRLDFLHRGMPITIDAVERSRRSDLLREHLGGGWSNEGPVLSSRVLHECRRFAAILALTDPARLPGWIQDMAAYELASVELRSSVEASADAALAGIQPPADSPLVLGRHVRVLSFGYDMPAVRLAPSVDSAPTSTHIALVKRGGAPQVQAYRLGILVATILRGFAEPCVPAAIVATLPNQEEQVTATVQKAISAGLLLAAG